MRQLGICMFLYTLIASSAFAQKTYTSADTYFDTREMLMHLQDSSLFTGTLTHETYSRPGKCEPAFNHNFDLNGDSKIEWMIERTYKKGVIISAVRKHENGRIEHSYNPEKKVRFETYFDIDGNKQRRDKWQNRLLVSSKTFEK